MTMSLLLAQLSKDKKLSRNATLALRPAITYEDGRTKQCYKDECDIDKIMSRFNVTGTISHLAKYGGIYADFSDFDFHKQNNMLTKGREIFDALPAELRREFGQSASNFFAYVNDPANLDKLKQKLPGLAAPGQQLPRTAAPDADLEAADAAASEPASEPIKNIPAEPESNAPASS